MAASPIGDPLTQGADEAKALSHRHENARVDHAPRGVPPAQQGLTAAEVPGAAVDLGLSVQLQAGVGLDGAAQVALKRRGLQHLLAHVV